MFLPFLIAVFSILLDQYIKFLTISNLQVGESASGIIGVIDFFYLQNTGAGWGMFSGRINLLVIVTILAVIYICYLIIKNRDHYLLVRIAYGLVLGGALGNFIDRIRLGYVIDMFRLKFINFPIFNVADISLTLGVILLISVMLFYQNSEDVL
ncbi:signal peptidase II [Aerococcaceae bacterium WGS1372]